MNLRTITGTILLSILILPINVSGRGFGLGIIAGEPTGISLKYWNGPRTAIDGAVAWSFSGDNSLHLHADYLLHEFKLIDRRAPLYYGIGARLKTHADSEFGIRIPLGIAYHPDNAPLDFFLEIVPVLDLIPDTELDVNAAIGARFYFN